MKVSKGFKQTEIGEIPEDWEQSYLGDLADKIIGGGTPSRSNPTYWGNEIPWVTVKDFSTFVPDSTQEYITYVGLKNSSTSLIPHGNLITSTRMALGKAVIYNVDVAINQDLKAIYLKKDIDRKYIYYWFQANSKKLQDLGSGSTVMGISTADLKSLSLPLPPLKEQQAIAEVLSDMDRMISQTEALIEKKKAIKQGMMQELLKPKKAGINANRKFKKTEIGEIPEDWEVISIGEIFRFYPTSNFSKSQMSLEGDVGCLHYGLIHSVRTTSFNVEQGIRYYVSSNKGKYEKIENGDVIMVDASEDLEGLNKSVEVNGVSGKAYIAGLHTFHLRDEKSHMASFFRGAMLNSNTVKSQMLRLAVGMKVFGVSKNQLKTVLLPLPPLKEQQAIADSLSVIDNNISTLVSKLQKLKLQKYGVMQVLLSGRVRLCKQSITVEKAKNQIQKMGYL